MNAEVGFRSFELVERMDAGCHCDHRQRILARRLNVRRRVANHADRSMLASLLTRLRDGGSNHVFPVFELIAPRAKVKIVKQARPPQLDFSYALEIPGGDSQDRAPVGEMLQ